MSDTKLKSLLDGLVKGASLLQATISAPKNKILPKKITIRPVTIKEKMVYQFSTQYSQKVMHENITTEQILDKFLSLMNDYKQALICTPSENFQILINKKGDATILRKAPSKEVTALFSHNRPKNYILREGLPIPFLVELGVMSSTGKVFADKRDKFRQINRFLETIQDIVSYLPKNKILQIVDFGCGKAYLTFALYHYLHQIENYDLRVTGLDLKIDVVEFCQSIASKLGYDKLQFLQGNIKNFTTRDPVDMMVCLHACDTATDAALEKAVRWKSKVILAVPCCQHELFKQVQCESLVPLLKHGILKERFAALITDAARAQLLEISGYKTQLLEFIDMEHTPKNLLIRAILQERKDQKNLMDEFHSFKNMLNITPMIEKLLLQ